MRRFAPLTTLLVLTLLNSCHSTRRAVSHELEQDEHHDVGFALSRQASLDSVLQITAMQFDSLEICIEPIAAAHSSTCLDDTAIEASASLATPYRYRLRAARASLHASATQVRASNSDTIAATATSDSRLDQIVSEDENQSSQVYKPPNVSFIIILAVVIIAFLLMNHKIRL